MSVIGKDNIALFPEEVLAALNLLQSLIQQAGLDARVEEALRLVPGKRAVFRGTLDGQAAVFRVPLRTSVIESFAAEWAELTRVWQQMNSGPYRVAQPLHFDPDTGLFALSYVTGAPLLTHLWNTGDENRLPDITRAAEWLYTYMEPTMEARGINRRPWRRWAGAAAEKQPHAALAAIEKRIFQKMGQLSKKLDQPSWRVAIPHGDFHLNNLILSPDTSILTGIDTGGSNQAPIYKDMARALTHMARRGMLPSGARRFGVDAAAFDAFSDASALSETERHAFLPYMIAFETLIKVEHPRMSEDRIAHALDMSHALFQDLREIT